MSKVDKTQTKLLFEQKKTRAKEAGGSRASEDQADAPDKEPGDV